MSNTMREIIYGVTPQDIKKINDNNEQMWNKVHGNIDFSDGNKGLQNNIKTQWLPVQNEGNYDASFPMYVRFYIPPNTSKVVSSNFNFVKERYRMDSGVAMGGGGVSDVDIAMSMGSSTVGVASVGGGGSTATVKAWYGTDPNNIGLSRPTGSLADHGQGSVWRDDRGYWAMSLLTDGKIRYGLPLYTCDKKTPSNQFDGEIELIDAMSLNHVHDLPSHSHNIALQPHTHSSSGRVSLPPHPHELQEGVTVSKVNAGASYIVLNGQTITHMDEQIGASSLNNIDVTDFIKIGEWNIMIISTNTRARMTVYGTVELITK